MARLSARRRRTRALGAARADRSFVLLIIGGVVAVALGLLALGILVTRWAVHALGAL